MIREALEDLETRLEQTGGTVNVGDLPEISADNLQMRQLFQNLISNALKFHKEGVPPMINISSKLRGKVGWEISVSDNGIGIEEKSLEKIFNPFERLHGRTSYEGSGMGLSICRKIVERHSGQITAKSQVGQGSSFIIILPDAGKSDQQI